MRLHKLPIILSPFLFVACVGIQGSGEIAERRLELSGGFDSVEVSQGIHVVVLDGDDKRVSIVGDDNIIERVDVKRSGRSISVDFDSHDWFSPTQPVEVILSARHLRTLDVSSGGHGEVSGMLTEKLKVIASGGATINITDLKADELVVDLSGGSKAEIHGAAKHEVVEASGGSKYTATALNSLTTTADVSGGSHGRVRAEESVHVEASGGSRVWVVGTAAIGSDVSGGSQVDRL